MRGFVAAVRAFVRRPVVQDAGLAAVLLGLTQAQDASVAPFLVNGDGPAEAPTGPPVGLWWVATGLCVAAVLFRRRWPLPGLVAALLGSVVHMAVAANPVPADLAAPILLYTIASRWPRKASLWILGATLLVALGWSVYVMRDGKADGWMAGAPQEVEVMVPPQPPPPPLPPVVPVIERAKLGPTAWGGFPILGSILVTGWAIGWSVQSRRAYLDELRARARDLERERDQQAALAAAAERSRITRELHDVVAHGLSVIVMQAQGGIAAFEKQPSDTLAALHTIVSTGRASLSDMRQVLAAVGPVDETTHPVPGLSRVPPLVEQVRQAGTPVRLHIEGTPGVLPASVDVSAYRIVQEALTNTMKHAGQGACAQVLITYGKDALTIDVSDNGTAEAGPPADGVGNGLRGMRERAALLGGSLFTGPGPDGGFVVRASLPIVREPAA